VRHNNNAPLPSPSIQFLCLSFLFQHPTSLFLRFCPSTDMAGVALRASLDWLVVGSVRLVAGVAGE
jgi:hypothetical protein